MTTDVTRPKLYSVSEVAQELRLSRPTVYKLIAGGALSAIRVGGGDRGSLRVTRDDLGTYLNGRRTK